MLASLRNHFASFAMAKTKSKKSSSSGKSDESTDTETESEKEEKEEIFGSKDTAVSSDRSSFETESE